MPEPSSLASWTPALRKQLDALGVDSNALCQSAGIDSSMLGDPGAQFPSDITADLWQRAVQACLDPTLGLRV
ncbi:helix-turn-helix protein [Pseudomonas savastanoi pv. glycinea]|uniref:Helix-turn-helix protein n=2 Tax=Pseudomonas savastanoi TaxID=29438 RepID=A0A0P9RTA8_PSESG|nr:helix-turn-helix protein [Pseudomonas savastanoi pv. phaseolicola]KPB64769.1 helix-turn-helix protein [Pseudomonas amygdali pv. mellea]KPB87252.1 helix-turn-helix protein [Pseudomonas syringae pv. maculicola]KPC24480.1 helix-turn-helix protein [Pseudomonas savastanoi pv. glycinea]KPB37895.1 helix-turn-helix protein [Pseudomonas savastanoi pv. phaseolicola]